MRLYNINECLRMFVGIYLWSEIHLCMYNEYMIILYNSFRIWIGNSRKTNFLSVTPTNCIMFQMCTCVEYNNNMFIYWIRLNLIQHENWMNYRAENYYANIYKYIILYLLLFIFKRKTGLNLQVCVTRVTRSNQVLETKSHKTYKLVSGWSLLKIQCNVQFTYMSYVTMYPIAFNLILMYI